MKLSLKAMAGLAAFTLLGGELVKPAYAWDGIIRSTIVGVEPSGTGLTVYFQGFPKVCSSGARSGFLPAAAPNYQTYVSVVLTAMSTKTPVYVYTSAQGGGCHIGVITAGDTPLPP